MHKRGYWCYLLSSLNSLMSTSYGISSRLRNLVDGIGNKVLRVEDLGESVAL